MSLFRKPKKIQRRVFCADDEDDSDPEPPPPPTISQAKKETKPVKQTPLLSFADEEEETEVFKVKKSSQSKRLAKRREKEKRVNTDGDSIKYDNGVDEEKTDNNGESSLKPKKKVTLEGLILSGRAALAADGKGDLSDESEQEEDDNRGFHQYRAESVRAALAVAQGPIPDAALIHAARKTRQQARELGGDYIPVRNDSAPGSRLIRDDDGSGDDDDDEGRLHVRGLDLPSDKPKRDTHAASADEELDSEVEEWEEQQMQKAMPAIPEINCMSEADINPFAVCPTSAPIVDPTGPCQLAPLRATTAQQLFDALKKRVEELKSERDAMAAKKEEFRDRLLKAARVRENRAARCGDLDATYKRAQAARGFITDLIECLDEKMPELEKLEARALSLHKRRCDFLMERRRADVRDQAQDVMALASRPGAAKPVDSEEKRRRTAEREGRRRARRLRRETAANAHAQGAPRHRDGDSSDDDLPPHLQHNLNAERESIRSGCGELFADALPAWRGVAGVCARVSRLRRRDPALYTDAYVADCLPQLLAPYVRHELVLWNPLADEDNEDYERMSWFKCLMMYGVRSERVQSDSEDSDSDREENDGEIMNVSEKGIREDPDLLLVPTIVNKVVLPKLTELVEAAWDPMCVRACVRLRQLLVRAAAIPLARGAALRSLAAAVTARLAACVSADVFLPTLPPQILEGAGGPFWRRCLGAGVRLLRSALALCAPPDLLQADRIVMALLDTLCLAAGAAPPAYSAAAASALADTLPRTGELRTRAQARLAALAQRHTLMSHEQ